MPTRRQFLGIGTSLALPPYAFERADAASILVSVTTRAFSLGRASPGSAR
jgi:hypothetical protein